MIISATVITNRVRALAGDAGLKVELSDKDIAATDGTTIFLKRPSWSWTKEELIIWEGNAYHEVGHCSPANKDIFDVIHNKPVHMASRLGKALNALDDLRQEHEQYGRFSGRDRVMGESNRLMLTDHVKSGMFERDDGDEGIAFMQVLFAYMTFVMEWYPAMAGVTDKVLEKLPPAVMGQLQTLIEHDDEINPIGCDAEETYSRSKRLLELLGFDAEQEEQDAKDRDEAEKQLSEAAKAFGEELFKHMHTDEFTEIMSEDGEGESYKLVDGEVTKEDGEKVKVSMPPPEDDSTGYVPSDWNHMELRDYSKVIPTARPDHNTEAMVEKGMFLGTQVRKLLQTMSMTRNIHGMKKGRLGKNLHRATMKDSGQYQQKIFKKKTQAISLDVAVQLVVDGSGSMNGQKYEAASASAVIMSHVLSQLMIKHEIVVFTEVSGRHGPVLRHGIIKSFEKSAEKERLMSAFQDFNHWGLEQNLDGESIMWSAMRLLKQTTVRKICIVFSDGAPAAYRDGANEITRDAIKELEARRDMELYGIGIMSRSVEKYYKDCEVISSTSGLETALLGVIKSKILRK